MKAGTGGRAMRRSTALDVARAAGVSKWTVMRAFKPGASIAEASRQRVIAAAERLDYRPNLVARSLATSTTQQVAILVDDFGNPYKLPTLQLLTAALQAEDMVAMLININQRFDHVHALLNAGQRQVDAVVLFGTSFRDETLHDRPLIAGGPPIYVVARESTVPAIPSVACDCQQSIEELCRYLHGRGYRRPGFMSGPKDFSTALGRHHHFLAFWARHGITEVPELAAGAYERLAGERTLAAYLADPAAPRLDLLMCETDVLALGAMDAARRRLNVPRDLAIAGYDGNEISGAAAYDLTTYEQPVEAMVAALVDMITGRRPPGAVRLPGRLLVRGSA
jgi:LacI family transcriptional regulator